MAAIKTKATALLASAYRTDAKWFQQGALTQTVQAHGKQEQHRWGDFAQVLSFMECL
jgi:hypothetical protein